jgi:hypothetical protein
MRKNLGCTKAGCAYYCLRRLHVVSKASDLRIINKTQEERSANVITERLACIYSYFPNQISEACFQKYRNGDHKQLSWNFKTINGG